MKIGQTYRRHAQYHRPGKYTLIQITDIDENVVSYKILAMIPSTVTGNESVGEVYDRSVDEFEEWIEQWDLVGNNYIAYNYKNTLVRKG